MAFCRAETVVAGKPPLAITQDHHGFQRPLPIGTPKGSMLEDLVKQLPGGEIDGDGKLSIHGKEVKKILKDPKKSSLRTIPKLP